MGSNTPFILSKIFNKEQYATQLLDGVIYINPVATFGAGPLLEKKRKKFDKYRDDLNEGLTSNIGTDTDDVFSNVQAISFFQDIGGIPRDVRSVGEIDSRFLKENIYCLSALFFDSLTGQLCEPNEEMIQFTDNSIGKAVVIYDVKQFLTRLFKALADTMGSPFWAAYGLVDYDYDKNESADVDEFTKESEFAYQQEFRIAINLLGKSVSIRDTSKVSFDTEKGSLSINIGSIRDIAFALEVKDCLRLNFPAKYNWIKNKCPDIICPFYPPMKNETSYIYPLMRTDESILISSKALYPAQRGNNEYIINMKRLEKTLQNDPDNDSFFFEILEMYASRLLDIYKSMEDVNLLEKTLSAFSCYLLRLHIHECAGIIFQDEGGGFRTVYHDITIHDLNLTEKNGYNVIKRKSNWLKPTDFAVLLSLSDQTSFVEYEYQGEKYIQIKVSRNGVLSSGRSVKSGDVVWVKVSLIKWILPEFTE